MRNDLSYHGFKYKNKWYLSPLCSLDDAKKLTFGDDYYTQTIVPEFQRLNPELTADWDVVYDARGHFEEPHGGDPVPLGTVEVRDYLSGRAGVPNHKYGAILLIEKEGFEPREVLLAQRSHRPRDRARHIACHNLRVRGQHRPPWYCGYPDNLP